MKINKAEALLLARCCLLTYNQYEKNGEFTPPEHFKVVDTFKADVFGSKEWFGFIIESKDSIIVAFRGTDSDPDWIADADIIQHHFPYDTNKTLVHGGFLSIYESCRNQLLLKLHSLSDQKKLFITGHSLGAALAVLHAMDVYDNTDYKELTLFTLAGPRVGNGAFASSYNHKIKNSIRVVNTNDIIPMLPPKRLYNPFTGKYSSYRHVSKQVSFSHQTGTLRGNHSIYTYIKGLEEL
ncbi:lipase family protein [Cytobacillus suaedae]|nr:lipase family protein [Cytobacillus suaedae]